MRVFGLLLYLLICLRIGICYPRYRDLCIRLRMPVYSMVLMTGGILLLCLARHVSFRVYACLPSLLLCAWIDLEQKEIPDLCHIIPAAVSLITCSVCSLEALVLFLILLPFVLCGKMGAGDLKLLTAYTLLLSENIVFAVLTACLTALFVHGKRPDAVEFAFGPYLSFGIFSVLFLLR
ncbi:MAG: prepilin peptidase [Solobacterium sp.]|nr:prepilin peptidase [Solobacterium sp.]